MKLKRGNPNCRKAVITKLTESSMGDYICVKVCVCLVLHYYYKKQRTNTQRRSSKKKKKYTLKY